MPHTSVCAGPRAGAPAYPRRVLAGEVPQRRFASVGVAAAAAAAPSVLLSVAADLHSSQAGAADSACMLLYHFTFGIAAAVQYGSAVVVLT